MNRQEVINALEQAVEHQVCKDRTFRFDGMERDYCVPDLMYDALALLKAQEPVYPTWIDVLILYGVTDETGYNYLDSAYNPIPADIAEKLGIEPKEG